MHSRRFQRLLCLSKQLILQESKLRHGYGKACSTLTSTEVTDDSSSQDYHIPVLVSDVLYAMEPQNGQVFVDMTFGAGGHTKAILNAAPKSKIITLDRDPFAYDLAVNLSRKFDDGQIVPLLGKFSEIGTLLASKQIAAASVDGFLFDVGSSSIQFDQSDRGFSISKDGPLDMRMDGERIPNQPTAADIVNYSTEDDLRRIISKYGEEKAARKIAHAIVESRYAFGKITRTKQLSEIISSVFLETFKHDMLMRPSHVATKTFQALRIFVNDELNELHNGLQLAYHFLKPGGRCLVISFHSLEDRIVKRNFHGIDIDEKLNMTLRDHRYSNRHQSKEALDKILVKKWQPLQRKVLKTTMAEKFENPRSRSAKLRAAIKCDVGEENSS